jgi:chromosome segregation ATPase
MSSSEQLNRVGEKLQQLLKQFEWIKKEKEKLSLELKQLKQKELGYHEKISNLEQQVMVLKATGDRMEEPDKKQLEKRLNGYLKEIDRCITMLSE